MCSWWLFYKLTYLLWNILPDRAEHGREGEEGGHPHGHPAQQYHSVSMVDADMRIVLLGSGSIIVNLSGSSPNLKIF